MGIILKIVIPLILAFLVQYAFRLWFFFDYHKDIIKHSPGKCHLVPDIHEGSEDLQTLSTGVAIITSGIRFGHMNDHPTLGKRKGAFYKFDFNNVEAGARKITVKGIDDSDSDALNPHGLSIWEENGEVTVFVVNHPRRGEVVDKYRYNMKDNILSLISTTSHHSMTCLNDVVATGPDSFYVTNNAGCSLVPESFLPVNRGNLVHCEGTAECRVVVNQLNAPNGINMSPTGRYVYLSLPFSKAINVYERKSSNDLILLETIQLSSAPDNLDVQRETGDIWVGANPVLHLTVASLENPDIPAPSQVLRLRMSEGGRKVSSMEEMHLGNGELIHTATIASYYKHAMLVGTVAHKLMYCQVNYLEE